MLRGRISRRMCGCMGEWSSWFRVVKETGLGRKYLYLQRVRRAPRRKDPEGQSRSLWRINPNPVPRRRRAFNAAEYEQSASGLALAIFGWEDEFGRPRDSLYNRILNEERLEGGGQRKTPNRRRRRRRYSTISRPCTKTRSPPVVRRVKVKRYFLLLALGTATIAIAQNSSQTSILLAAMTAAILRSASGV